MRKFRSIALSLVTVVLLAVVIPLFAPGLTTNVNAASDVVEVGTLDSLSDALVNSSNKNKLIRLTSDIESDVEIYISYPLTLDLNGHSIKFSNDGFLGIYLSDPDDIVTFTGNGYISGNYYGGGIIYVNNGSLVFESGTVENLNKTQGCPINLGDNRCTIKNGVFIGKDSDWFYEVGENVTYYSYYNKYDSKTGLWSDFFNELKVAGKSVDSMNCKDILGDGVFSYDFENKTLHINGNCNYSSKSSVVYSYVSGLIIDIQGPSSLVGNLNLNGDTTITGNNKLIVTFDDLSSRSVYCNNLLIKDVSIEFQGKGDGIRSFDGELTIENALINDNTDGESIRFDNVFSLNHCKIVEPEKAVIKSHAIYMENGTDIATKLVILPDNMWGPIEYTWSDDYSKCTAKHICLVDPTMIETETVTTTSKVKTPSTTSEKGTTTYTATFLNKSFATQTKDVQNIPVIEPTATPEKGGGFEDFVERLYTVALGRASEPEGKAFWCEHVGNGNLNGAQCANEFLLSKEFKDRGLSDEDFLKVLYKTFFDRDAAADPDGFNFWMNSLKTQGRDTVVDCFINSTEWCNVCASYGVKSGATRAKATMASANATAFAKRLYTECLGREAEEEGLNFWALGLTNLELTGKQAAYEFFFSKEFNDHNFDNKELITRMYKTFMGREPDEYGMNFWLDSMKNGMTKEQVFNEFVNSAEFTGICKDYAIDRG